jgi:hypothetical protein
VLHDNPKTRFAAILAFLRHTLSERPAAVNLIETAALEAGPLGRRPTVNSRKFFKRAKAMVGISQSSKKSTCGNRPYGGKSRIGSGDSWSTYLESGVIEDNRPVALVAFSHHEARHGRTLRRVPPRRAG